ncbi:hypothetical protein F4778DRAFT_734264 [Xylariomycetidae sp. FL2044]|nr:hypothetical protein F4778DRAFT_734264 [Xylariomycetidae sp. FL2044]
MTVLSAFASPLSLQVGLRATARRSEKRLLSSLTRQFSTARPPIERCFGCSRHSELGPLRLLRHNRALPLLTRPSVRTLFGFRPVTLYQHVPDSYEDAIGLPFRKHDLTQRDINAIFGPHLTAEQANQLLKIIHGRRVAGTLDDPELQQNTAQFATADKVKALEYLREKVPVDEVTNSGLRAEDELRYLTSQDKPFAGEQTEGQPDESEPQEEPPEAEPQRQDALPQEEEGKKAPTGRLPKEPSSDSPYGVGAFDRIRAQNIAKREAEEKRAEELRLEKEREDGLKNVGTLQTEQAKPREMSPYRKKHFERATSNLTEPPEMKAWERLLPSYAMAILVCLGCITFAAFYTPPRRSWRVWPDIPPAAATCLTLIGLNLAVWSFWKLPPAWRLLNTAFLVVPATPRPIQLVGAMFSHQHFAHLASNMVALWFFGTRLHDDIGRGNFLAVYAASGVMGFVFSMTNLVLFRGLNFTTLGASGAIYGVIASYFWRHKFEEFKILGYPPDPMSGPQGLAFIGLILGLHILALFSKKAKHQLVDLASHIGGMVTGILGTELVQRHLDNKARMRAERLKTMGVLDKVVQKKPRVDVQAVQR